MKLPLVAVVLLAACGQGDPSSEGLTCPNPESSPAIGIDAAMPTPEEAMGAEGREGDWVRVSESEAEVVFFSAKEQAEWKVVYKDPFPGWGANEKGWVKDAHRSCPSR